MGRNTLLVSMLILSAALPLASRPQQQESLGDLARQIREQHDKEAKKTIKVYTNDNLPGPKTAEAVNAPTASPAPVHPATTGQTTSPPATPPPSEDAGSKPPESPEDKAQSRDYWQGKFQGARRDVAKAKEMQQLAEDELNLLQIQQVRVIDPAAKADLTSKVQAKQSEVDVNRATTEAAQQALDDLEKLFRDSGAPEDWSQTE
ncbi:MAG: hypothetical protein ABSG32_15305 [Terriglobia bacterium]|jgi:hypothetical protein